MSLSLTPWEFVQYLFAWAYMGFIILTVSWPWSLLRALVLSVVQCTLQRWNRWASADIAAILVFLPGIFLGYPIFHYGGMEYSPWESRIQFARQLVELSAAVFMFYWFGTALALANWKVTSIFAHEQGRAPTLRANRFIKIFGSSLLLFTFSATCYFTTYKTLEDAVTDGNLELAERRLRFNLFGVGPDDGRVWYFSSGGVIQEPLLPIAIRNNDIEMVRLLLEYGASLGESAYGLGASTFVGYAASRGNLQIVAAMIEHGADPTEALHSAARANNVEILQYLLDRGADARRLDDQGRTLLDTAALAKAEEAVRFLSSGVDGSASEKALSDQSASRAGSP